MMAVNGIIAPYLDKGGAVYNVKSFGAMGDGTTDDTLAIQAAMDAAALVKGTVVLPGGDYLVYPHQQAPIRTWATCLNVPSNVTVRFEGNARLIMDTFELSRYAVLSMEDVENIVIEHPTIVGDADSHSGGGEQGHGIQLLGVENVRILYPHVTRCWGDGIYFGTYATAPAGRPNRYVTVDHPVCSRNGRNGISVTSGQHIYINHPVLEDNDRTLPMAGFDIEPNVEDDLIDDVVFLAATCRGGDRGFMVALQKSVGVGTVQVLQPKVEDTNTGCYIMAAGNEYRVLVDRPDFKDLLGRAINVSHWVSPSTVLIRDPKIRTCNQTTDTEAILVGNPNSRAGVVGDVYITGIDIDSPDTTNAVRLVEISDSITTYGTPTNINLSFARCKVAGPPLSVGATHMDARIATAREEDLTLVATTNLITVDNNGYYLAYVGKPDQATHFSLDISRHFQGQDLTFYTGSFGDSRVIPAGSEAFEWPGAGNGDYLRCQAPGGKLVIRSTGTGWRVIEMVGQWELPPP